MAMATVPFAINTYGYMMNWRAKDCLSHLAQQGYDTFELMLFPGHLWPAELDKAQRQELRRFIAGQGWRITTLNMPNIDINLAAATPEMRAYSLASISAAVRLAGDLGVPCVLIGPGKPNPLFPLPQERLTEYFFAALDQLVGYAEDCGTSLAIENLPIAFLPDADSLMATLDTYGNAKITVVYDLANAVFHGEDPIAGLRRVAPRLRLIHLSDTTRERYRHDPVGQGIVPFDRIPPVLDEIGYDKAAILEIISTDPDTDIHTSATRLIAMGWRAMAAQPR